VKTCRSVIAMMNSATMFVLDKEILALIGLRMDIHRISDGGFQTGTAGSRVCDQDIDSNFGHLTMPLLFERREWCLLSPCDSP